MVSIDLAGGWKGEQVRVTRAGEKQIFIPCNGKRSVDPG